jgi:type I restriction enzyme M protein
MNTEIKRHIDGARQVLVGVVPNPTSQIEQITNALIYKFMDDMDQAAIRQGDRPAFFTKDLERYAWTRLMDARIGNQERMNLYSEALVKFSQAAQLPDLFRSIFKSAFLPYRSPETLGLFLKEINFFDYSHPEELGNAYEYLLSIMSSQGDAGQFRTPRHIIDFIVDVVNPTKNDKVLDPACGTGGFLVKAYQHILEQINKKDANGNKPKPLTPDERKKLMNNFEGYDIDPTMVRISQVNMYLHQFKNPKIYQYDTLSNEDRWNDKFDVILANPPFMSPRGGIKPHSKFSVQSSRSEVLFVDYIMNHLRPKGRAGIIVPEGIIFQSGASHKQLRKNLVEDGLYCVASLPSGVFAPYSGVKTSILFFDNERATSAKEILFIKIENDGFDLGATKRPITKNDLPQALEIINLWKTGKKSDNKLAVYVEKSNIGKSGDYNLSGDRYRIATDYTNAKWPMVKLGEVAEILKGSAITKKDTVHGNIPVIAGGQEPAYYHNEANRNGNIITVSASGAYAGFVNYFEIPIFASDCSTVQTKNKDSVSTKFIFNILKDKQADIYAFQQGGGQPHVYPKDLKTIKIPLPPLEIQEQIVAELDSYQKIIDGTKQIAANWKPKIEIDPKWEKVKLGEVGKISMCKRIFKEQTTADGDIPFYKIGTFGKTPDAYISQEVFDDYRAKFSYPKKGEVLISTSGTIGITVVFDGEPAYFQDSNIVWIENDEKKVYNSYLNLVFQDIDWITTKGGTIERLYNKLIEEQVISIPPLEIQKQIIEKIEAERALVESAKKLIAIYEQKTKETIGKLWI